MTDKVRDAMIPEPLTLEASASAQTAGEHLTQPDVRAVYVTDDGRFAGVITRKTLVREVVAAGRDPRETTSAEGRGGSRGGDESIRPPLLAESLDDRQADVGVRQEVDPAGPA